MEEAFSSNNEIGSSTCIIGVIKDNKVKIANLGDSGFMHLKKINGEWCRLHYSEE